MPSEDPRIRLALDALAGPIAQFRSALAAALRQAQAALGSPEPAGEAERARAKLGEFAAGRIRPDGFAALTRQPSPDPAARRVLAGAITVLHQALDQGEQLFVGSVPRGGDLHAAAGAALARAGQAFGAILLSELVRGSRYRAADHDRLLDPAGFESWSRAQRRFAPPLVISLAGADLHPSALGDFCDGRAKLVLVVDAPAPPAPLVRAISPGTLVLQTTDGAGLERAVRFEGPAVAALMPEGAARFLHDPERGREPWQRLSVDLLPDPPRHALGGMSAWQMGEDLRQLESLANTPFVFPSGKQGATAAIGSADAVERLADWLLERSEAGG